MLFFKLYIQSYNNAMITIVLNKGEKMKKSILTAIFYGEKGHPETIKEGPEYWKVMDETNKLSDELVKGLTEKQKELFDKLCFSSMGLEAEATLTYFKEGFKIGLLLGIECTDE